MKKTQTLEQKEQRLVDFVNRAYELKRGDRIRQVARIVADAYKGKSNQLKEYFDHGDEKLAGIATSAYFMLTDDMRPLKGAGFGGLGLILSEPCPGEHHSFSRNQLHFARLSGFALNHSMNSGNALWHSRNSGGALNDSENSGCALKWSINTDHTLWSSLNSDDALAESTNLSMALDKSVNKGRALSKSENFQGALKDSQNSDSALSNSKNLGQYCLHESINRNNALNGSVNLDGALRDSQNFGWALVDSTNYVALEESVNRDHSLARSKNYGSLFRSRNYDCALEKSLNCGNSLKDSTIGAKCLYGSQNTKEVADNVRERQKFIQTKLYRGFRKLYELLSAGASKLMKVNKELKETEVRKDERAKPHDSVKSEANAGMDLERQIKELAEVYSSSNTTDDLGRKLREITSRPSHSENQGLRSQNLFLKGLAAGAAIAAAGLAIGFYAGRVNAKPDNKAIPRGAAVSPESTPSPEESAIPAEPQKVYRLHFEENDVSKIEKLLAGYKPDAKVGDREDSYRFDDGSVYFGKFHDGKIEGIGTMYLRKGNSVELFDGYFKDGKYLPIPPEGAEYSEKVKKEQPDLIKALQDYNARQKAEKERRLENARRWRESISNGTPYFPVKDPEKEKEREKSDKVYKY
jgi:hypothetical protein